MEKRSRYRSPVFWIVAALVGIFVYGAIASNLPKPSVGEANPCPECRGTGRVGTIRCPACYGTGWGEPLKPERP